MENNELDPDWTVAFVAGEEGSQARAKLKCEGLNQCIASYHRAFRRGDDLDTAGVAIVAEVRHLLAEGLTAEEIADHSTMRPFLVQQIETGKIENLDGLRPPG